MCEVSAPHHVHTLATTGHQAYKKPSETLAKWTVQKELTYKNTSDLLRLKTPLKKAYERTLKCGAVIIQNGNKYSFWRCRTKWCRGCCNIRTADLINGYQHLLNDFVAPHMVVLTMKNCKGRELASRYKKMVHAFKLATRNISKTHGIRMHGIRTWECTYNDGTDEYHPHFNVVVDTKEGADLLRAYWMNYWNTRGGANTASIKGQFITPISSSDDLLEVFKYTTKLSVSHNEEVKAQDWIYQCTKGKRLAQPFGILRKVKIEDKAEHTEVVESESRMEIWGYEDEVKQYVNAYGESLATDEAIKAYKNKRKNKHKHHEYKPK